MTYAVTGASGPLGGLAVEALLERGVPAGEIVAIVRDPDKAAGLAARDVQVRRGDYSEPGSLATALDGVDRLLLVSGSEVGRRVAQHGNVIDAARAAGVGRIVYTSLPRADTSSLPLAPEHKATEELLAAADVATTVLRNNWYAENYTARTAEYVERGAILSATGDGRIGLATRADYAAAAAAALVDDSHAGRTYELAGPPVTLGDLAAAITEVTGRTVVHTSVTPAELVATLTGAGLDEGTAQFVGALDEGISRGDLDVDSTDLVALVGRPSTPLVEAVRAALG
ncbi:SDR family oxidoreductase [Pseudonocardia endophytica]|uniref:NAD(P)H dehydrogenase (Quinone) n=1 Tax=Pseudonocardia endophytica TaxID=401976 RepID=A0A4R1HU37_PSEEN|nr:SDR family oxidoreductase [Pseudonocardia endophytica]TCK26187.1 NAD(P)H dehydrogenase (quinone) [Pseudonocardia endophytica]